MRIVALCAVLAALSSPRLLAATAMPPEVAIGQSASPSVSVTGAATTVVQNDRMIATVRVEVDHANAASAANEVNARMAKALARAKAIAGIDAKSVGYSTWQTYEKGKPSRWRVVQSLQLTSTDFGALATLLTRLQDDDGMLLSGMAFTVSPDTRRKAEDALTREAIRSWQQRAATAADALGYANWRPGRVNVVTGDIAMPRAEAMMMRAQASATAAPPVAVEGGTTELTVTVSGEALLDNLRSR